MSTRYTDINILTHHYIHVGLLSSLVCTLYNNDAIKTHSESHCSSLCRNRPTACFEKTLNYIQPDS